MKYKLLKLFVSIVAIVIAIATNAQEERRAISFQGILKQNDNLLIEQTVYFRLALYSDTTNTPLWEELQDTISNEFALFNIYLGAGIATGNALTDEYIDIEWSDPMWMKIDYRLNEADNFEYLGIRKFQSIPFAMHTEFASGENVGIGDLYDVENNEELDYILRWDGEKWISSTDAVYAWNSINADSSIYADTVLYALNMLNPVLADSVIFAFYSDSIEYAINTDSSKLSGLSTYSDTSSFSFEVLNSWALSGNEGNNIIGNSDSTDFVIKSNDIEALRITAAGEILINSLENNYADLQLNGSLLLRGEHQNYSLSTTLENVFYWETQKSSLVVGNDITPYFMDSLKGEYSFAGGFQSLANSYSIAWGDSCISSGNNMVVFGSNNVASRVAGTKYATGIVMGYNNSAETYRAVVLGSNNKIYGTGGGNVIIGHNSETSAGSNRISIGSDLINDGQSAFLLGFHLKSSISDGLNKGSSMIGDNSTTVYLEDLGNISQLLIRAAGGTIIYSDSLATTGVSLSSGSGSWSMLSDINQKENILQFHWNDNIDLIKIPIYKWNYKAQSSQLRHLGVFAQDFNDLVDLKEDKNRISMVDMDGFILAGTKQLLYKYDEDENAILKVEKELNEIKADQDQILELLMEIEKRNKGGK